MMLRAIPFFLALLLTAEMSGQAIQALALKTSADRESYRRIQTSLANQTVTIEWTDRELKDALRELAKRTGVNIIAAREVREKLTETLSLSVNDLPVRSVLGILADRFDLVFLHQRGYLSVTTPEEAVKQSLTLGFYSVAELLYSPPDFPANRRGIGIPVGNPADDFEDEVPSREEKDPELLLDLVRKGTGGDKAWEVEGVSLTLHRNRLIVRHTPTMQRKVSSFLSRLRGVF